MVEAYGTGAVARQIGSSEAGLQSFLRRHPDLLPAQVVCGRRLWTPDEIARLKQARAERSAGRRGPKGEGQ